MKVRPNYFSAVALAVGFTAGGLAAALLEYSPAYFDGVRDDEKQCSEPFKASAGGLLSIVMKGDYATPASSGLCTAECIRELRANDKEYGALRSFTVLGVSREYLAGPWQIGIATMRGRSHLVEHFITGSGAVFDHDEVDQPEAAESQGH